MVYALDALFGLPRKKAAGCSYRPAILGKFFFCDKYRLMSLFLQREVRIEMFFK